MSEADDPIGEGYSVHVYAETDTVTDDDVLSLWARGSVDADEARRRIAEVLLVATHEEAGLAGLMTAYVKHDPVLRVDLWHLRFLVGARHRRSNISLHMSMRSLALLEERFVAGEDTRGIGILYELENESMKAYFPEAFWKIVDATFVGESTGGAHVYVRYFPGALVPDP